MTSGCTIIVGVSYRIYFVGVLNIGEKLNKSPIAKIKSSPINLPVRYIHNQQLHRNYNYIIYTRLSTRLSTSGGYVLCQVYSNSDRQTDTFLNVLTYIIFIFTEYFRMSSGKPFKKIAQPSIPETLFD